MKVPKRNKGSFDLLLNITAPYRMVDVHQPKNLTQSDDPGVRWVHFLEGNGDYPRHLAVPGDYIIHSIEIRALPYDERTESPNR